jgi:glucose/arabinose dehydrogenase
LPSIDLSMTAPLSEDGAFAGRCGTRTCHHAGTAIALRNKQSTSIGAPMPFAQSFFAVAFGAVLVLSACSETSKLPDSALTGRQPTIAAPERTLVPTVKIAPAIGWPAGATPQAAAGTRVAAFAADLAHPRWLLALPNGDVLVAETNAPPRPEDEQGLRAWVMKVVMKRAGAGVPSANRITLLRDADGDGRAELRSVFIRGLNSPFGMALVGDRLYVANTDAVVSFPYQAGQTRIDAAPTVVAELPAGPRNHHWTKNLIASADGAHLYVTVGSNSNVAENGIDAEQGRAAIWEVDLPSGAKRLYASGLRNPNGLAWSGATCAPSA